MVNEMFLAEQKWLPQLNEKEIKELTTITILKDTVPVSVPEDPALAINNRYKILGQ